MRLHLLCEDPYIVLREPVKLPYPHSSAIVEIDAIDPRFEDWDVHEQLGIPKDTLFARSAEQVPWQARLKNGAYLLSSGKVSPTKLKGYLVVPDEWVAWSQWLLGNDIVKQARKLRETEVLRPRG